MSQLHDRFFPPSRGESRLFVRLLFWMHVCLAGLCLQFAQLFDGLLSMAFQLGSAGCATMMLSHKLRLNRLERRNFWGLRARRGMTPDQAC